MYQLFTILMRADIIVRYIIPYSVLIFILVSLHGYVERGSLISKSRLVLLNFISFKMWSFLIACLIKVGGWID